MSFSEDTLERFRRAAYQGIEQPPHALGMAGSFRRGNFVVVGLSFHQKRVSKARFQSSNCLPTIAAADWLCEQVEGTAGEFVSGLTIEDLAEALGGIPSRIPPEREKYVRLSTRALLGCDDCSANPVCGGGCRLVVVSERLDLDTGIHPGHCLNTRAHARAVYRIYNTLMEEQPASFTQALHRDPSVPEAFGELTL